jgi:hypothetical protein
MTLEELDEAVVTCFVDAVAEFGGVHTEAEAEAEGDDENEGEDEDEGTDSVFIHQVKSVISFCNKANGRNPCVWCSEDDTITTSTTYEGTSMLMEHLLSSRLSHLCLIEMEPLVTTAYTRNTPSFFGITHLSLFQRRSPLPFLLDVRYQKQY